ncbi:DUF4328 domain-containing protein [Streptomyces sp. NPDC006446]|uniref:DUF4328 domain-containing protein n=1 Tax=Streptomyces sp. NPDC006446 TaxID=3154301 RepID=UPI0033B9608E
MAGAVRPPGWQARLACGTLAAFALVTVAAGLAAWHKYRLLAGPGAPEPYVDNPFVEVDTYFRNLMGWRTGLLLVALLQFSIWLANMRDIADVLWREGQRRRRAWLAFGWVIPVAQLFIPKMFINDLWAAGRPEARRRRGHPLLTAWWLSVLVAANAYNDAPDELKKAATASQARHALRQLMVGDGLLVCAAALSITVVWQLSRTLERALPTANTPADGLPETPNESLMTKRA